MGGHGGVEGDRQEPLRRDHHQPQHVPRASGVRRARLIIQVFTPLLAGTAVGTLEFRAALDPVRYRARNASYTQAWADSIDLDKRVISVTAATSPIAGRTEPDRYTISYDKLVLAPGACPSASRCSRLTLAKDSQTFGVEGVKEHAYFLSPSDSLDSS